jgi:hypothetical protein
MDSVKTGEREKIGSADQLDKRSPEIEISQTLFPWYGEWLFNHTEPGKRVLWKHDAIYTPVMEARNTLGYGSSQTLREYLKVYTNPVNGPFSIERHPHFRLMYVRRAPDINSIDDVLEKALYNLGRQRFLKDLEETGDRSDASRSSKSDNSTQPEPAETGDGKKAEGE